MNVRCPGCGATAEYSVKDLKMICKHCGKVFSAYEASGTKAFEEKKTVAETKKTESGKRVTKDDLRKHATIKMRHYHCSACGAELLAKETEATSFCYYCGQPAVMEEQFTDYLQPEYIIPFQVTQEEAAAQLQKCFRRGFFVPWRFKRFKVERLTPIYVPYWLIDVDYEDAQLWKYTVRKGKNHYETRYAKTCGTIKLDSYAVDASNKLEDYAGQRIGPFDFSGLLPFDPAYLSGYYADRFDVGAEDVESFVYQNVKEMFDWEMQKKAVKYSTDQVFTSPRYKLSKVEYALCPVWFLNVTMKKKVYTMLVNGQTGKVVFALPPSIWKAALCFGLPLATVTVVVGSILAEIFGVIANYHFNEDITKIVLGTLMLVIGAIGGFGLRLLRLGINRALELKRDIIRINGKDNLLYVKDRGTDAFQG